MNFKKKLLLLFSVLAFFIPNATYAYSDKVILGGNNIGITVNMKDVLVVGFYKTGGKYLAKESGIQIGDKITHVEGVAVNNIDEMIEIMNQKIKDNKVNITVRRNNKYLNFQINLVKEDGVYKTGLYIKDRITGIGTLTYIDPETKVYGALGHEITSSHDGKIIDISSGKIFKAIITGNTKSTNNRTGEKNAVFESSKIFGTIKENTIRGIYGLYTESLDKENLIDIAEKNEVSLGKAYIYTVIKDNDIEKFEINIIKLNEDSETKNILFEITDDKLLNATNGVIKGMSGSPIVQNGKLIGAVTHAIVNDANKGYGIYITTMLEEGEN